MNEMLLRRNNNVEGNVCVDGGKTMQPWTVSWYNRLKGAFETVISTANGNKGLAKRSVGNDDAVGPDSGESRPQLGPSPAILRKLLVREDENMLGPRDRLGVQSPRGK